MSKHVSAAAKKAAKAATQPSNVPTTTDILNGPIEAQAAPVVIAPDRPLGEIESLIHFDELGQVTIGNGESANLTASEFGKYIRETTRSGESALERSANAFHFAFSHPGENGAFLRNVVMTFDDGSLSEGAVRNVMSIAKTVVPFRIKHGIKTPFGVLKDCIAAVRDPKTGETKKTDESKAVLDALTSGVITIEKDGAPVEVKASGGALKALRKLYDKNGALIPLAKALPPVNTAGASATDPAKPAPTGIAGEVQAERLASEDAAANATMTQAPIVGSIDPVQDARDKEFASVLLHFDAVLKFITDKSIVGDERESIVNRLRQMAKLLNLTLA